MATSSDRGVSDHAALAENLRIVASCGVEPTQLLTIALAHIDAEDVDEALDALMARRELLVEVFAETSGPPQHLAPAPAGSPLAKLRPEIGDHELREHLVFGELLGHMNAMQVLVYSVAGIELSVEDAAMLDDIFVILQVADPRIWPLAVTRNLFAAGRPLHARLLGGLTSMMSPYFAIQPLSRALELLAEIEAAIADGVSFNEWVDEALRSKRRLPGFGRPILHGDERVPRIFAAIERAGRCGGPNVRRALGLGDELRRRKGLEINAIMPLAALLRDLGFSDDAAACFLVHVLMSCVMMHAVVAPTTRAPSAPKEKPPNSAV